MDMNRRSLFNSLRINWLVDPASVRVQPWQVEDYRSISLDNIFDRLGKKDIFLDRTSFAALAENTDSPEELSDALLADYDFEASEQDQVYLLIFELWRRLCNEKPCISIFCDELDHQIFAYDHRQVTRPEDIQDAVASLEMILVENTDEGADPIQVFEMISHCCANDLETFLYDYIAEQIDVHNYSYAADLLESFGQYVKGKTWFDFLSARLLSHADPEGSNEIVKKLLKDIKKEQDLDLGLELLTFLAKGGEPELFLTLARQVVSILETEEDFQELLSICADYFHFLDQDHEEHMIQQILKDRSQNVLESQIQHKDEKVKEFLKIIK